LKNPLEKGLFQSGGEKKNGVGGKEFLRNKKKKKLVGDPLSWGKKGKGIPAKTVGGREKNKIRILPSHFLERKKGHQQHLT